MSFEVKVTEKSLGNFMVACRGAIDTQNCEKLESKLKPMIKAEPKTVVFDMERVNYITSMGINLMVKIEKEVKKKGGALIIINLPAQIKKVFDIISSLPSMYIFESIEEADQYLLKIQQNEIEKSKNA